MPPPLGFNLPVRPAHAPAASLSLARSRSGTGPPSLSGISVGSSEGRSAKSPVSPRAVPTSYGPDESRLAQGDSIPLLPVTPVDPGAWAAEHAHPPLPSEHEEDEERLEERRGSRPRVQFAPDASVALFDAEGSDEVGDGLEFEKPRGPELVYIVLSVVAVSVIGIGAVLTTLYDWVL